MKNLSTFNYQKDFTSLKLKLIKNINSCVSYCMSLLTAIAIIEFVRFCFDLYIYLH